MKNRLAVGMQLPEEGQVPGADVNVQLQSMQHVYFPISSSLWYPYDTKVSLAYFYEKCSLFTFRVFSQK